MGWLVDVCVAGGCRNLMLGYAVAFDGSDKNVVLAHNEEAFTSEGFCRSGDKGCRDERGLFRVTGRFKELIKTTGGEYVSPVPIEEAIVKVAPAISKCVVIGDKRKYSVALITLVQEGATGESPGNGVLTGLAKDVNPQVSTTEQAMDDVAWETYVSEAINKVNADGDVCRNSSYKVQKFMILPNDLSIAGDEMTPTLKLKRSTLEHKWAMQIEDLYASSTKDEGSVFANFPAAYVRFREHASGSRL
jgi:long-subunit acyl-CoA synthetase (AMP-forming)